MSNAVINSGRIDLINLGIITPMNVEGYLIFGLSKEWLNQFSSIPRFNASIDKKGRICIISEEGLKR